MQALYMYMRSCTTNPIHHPRNDHLILKLYGPGMVGHGVHIASSYGESVGS
jgi:hypothetical protein